MTPRQALFADGPPALDLPVCDHYCGTEPRMRKALALQRQMGPVFDVTLDCEDGAPVGAEREHVRMAAALVAGSDNAFGRVGIRVHPLDHPAFADDVATVLQQAGPRLAYVMVPKPRHRDDAALAVQQVARAAQETGRPPPPVHLLIETHGALRDVFAIAALRGVQSLSFGLMDFVSAHRGAVPQGAMSAAGQFSHPLVLRAKSDIAAACHAAGITPSHNVVTEFANETVLVDAATRACREFGYTRMWSIHPSQIAPIVRAFAPTVAEIDEAVAILRAAVAAQWAPIRHRDASGEDRLHDRASYRYFLAVLERARRTGQPIPDDARDELLS